MNEHKCDTCGGSGSEPCVGCGRRPHRGWNGVATFYYEHGGCSGARRDVPDCSVCLGAGTFSDRMPVADAMADAETLQRNRLLAPYPIWLGLQGAKCAGPILASGETRDSRQLGQDAARAAFRAVPGLRGE